MRISKLISSLIHVLLFSAHGFTLVFPRPSISNFAVIETDTRSTRLATESANPPPSKVSSAPYKILHPSTNSSTTVRVVLSTHYFSSSLTTSTWRTSGIASSTPYPSFSRHSPHAETPTSTSEHSVVSSTTSKTLSFPTLVVGTPEGSRMASASSTKETMRKTASAPTATSTSSSALSPQNTRTNTPMDMSASRKAHKSTNEVTIDALAALSAVLGVLLLSAVAFCVRRHLKYRKHSPILDEEVDPWEPGDGSMPHASQDWPENVMPLAPLAGSRDDAETMPLRALARRLSIQKRSRQVMHWRQNWNRSTTTIDTIASSSSASSNENDPIESYVDMYQQPLRRTNPQRALHASFMQGSEPSQTNVDAPEDGTPLIPPKAKARSEPGTSRWTPAQTREIPKQTRRSKSRSRSRSTSHNRSRTRLAPIQETEGYDFGESDPEWVEKKQERTEAMSSDSNARGETAETKETLHPALSNRRDLGEFARSGPR